MTKEELIQRGLSAKALLDSGVYRAALDHLEAQLAESWKASRPGDVQERERLYLMVQVMADLGRVLAGWAGTAALEIHESERRAKEAHIN